MMKKLYKKNSLNINLDSHHKNKLNESRNKRNSQDFLGNISIIN
jgi:hypothetical protein